MTRGLWLQIERDLRNKYLMYFSILGSFLLFGNTKLMRLVTDSPASHPAAILVKSLGNEQTFTFDPSIIPAADLLAAFAAQAVIHDVEITDQSIDEIVARMYQHHRGAHS